LLQIVSYCLFINQKELCQNMDKNIKKSLEEFARLRESRGSTAISEMKEALIRELKLLTSIRREAPYLSMRVDIPCKVILSMGKYIDQSEMQDLINTIGSHEGFSYRISANVYNDLFIEIFVKR